RIGEEIQLNRLPDNSICESADAQEISKYAGSNASLSWVKLRFRYVNKDNKVVAECQPTFGLLLPPKLRPPPAGFPTVVLKKNSTSHINEIIIPRNILSSVLNQSTASAPWCDSLGQAEFPKSSFNDHVRQLCRETPRKAAYCYIEASSLYTEYSFYAHYLGAPPYKFGSGYLSLSVEGSYFKAHLRQPGRVNLTCRLWNGLLPVQGTPPTDGNYFGDEILRIEYSFSCYPGYVPCLASKTCISSGDLCEAPTNCSSVACPPSGLLLCKAACVLSLVEQGAQCNAKGKRFCPSNGVCENATAESSFCASLPQNFTICEGVNETACPHAFGACLDFANCRQLCPRSHRLLPAAQLVSGFKGLYRGAPDPGVCRTGHILGAVSAARIRVLFVSPAPGIEMELDGRKINVSGSSEPIRPDSCFQFLVHGAQNVLINLTYSLLLPDGSECVMRTFVLLPPRALPPNVTLIKSSLSVMDTSVLNVSLSTVLVLSPNGFPSSSVCDLRLDNLIDLHSERSVCNMRSGPDIYGKLTFRSGVTESGIIEYMRGFLVPSSSQAHIRFEPNRNAATKTFVLMCQAWSGLPPYFSYTSSGSLVPSVLPSTAMGGTVIFKISVLHNEHLPVVNKDFFTFGVLKDRENEYVSQKLQRERGFMLQRHGENYGTQIRVGDMVSMFFCDDNTSELGALVLQGFGDDASGVLEYQLPNSMSWQTLNVSADKPAFKQYRMLSHFKDSAKTADAFSSIQCVGSISSISSSTQQLSDFLADDVNSTGPVTAMFLPANASIRFRPTVPASWSRSRAILAFTAAEKLVAQQQVYINPLVVSSVVNKSAAAGWVVVRPVTVGCDNQPWSGLQTDVCKICGGNGRSCIDCNGDANGTAIWNDCGNCVGGRTGKAMRYGKDCAGRCNGSFVSPIPGLCYNSSRYPTADEYIRSVWCDGNVNRTARTNKCGFCTEGSTGRSTNFGVGPCGCSNDTSCITGCDGVVEPSVSLRKTLDKCGRCLQPSDPQRDICNRIHFTISRHACVGSYAAQQQVTILSSSINITISSIALRLMRVTDRSFYMELQALSIDISSGLFRFSAPLSLVAGQYALQVKYLTASGATVIEDVSGGNLTIFGPPSLSSLSVGSGLTLENPVYSLPVRGQGFVNTPDLACLLYCDDLSRHTRCDPRTGFLTVPAIFDSATSVTCNISALAKVGQPLQWKLSVMNCKPQTLSHDAFAVFKQNSLSLSIRSSKGPVLLSATDDAIGYHLRLEFDTNIQLRQTACSAIFNASTLALIGSGSECYARANVLIVRKDRGTAICSGSRISINSNIIYVDGSDVSLATSSSVSNAVVNTNSREPPVIFLAGVQSDANNVATVGFCDAFTLYATVRGSMVQRITWDIRCATGSTCQTTELAAFQSKFSTEVTFYAGKDIPPGESYNITAFAQNECGTQSNTASIVVKRLDERTPFSINIYGQQKHVMPDQPYSAVLIVRPSFCYIKAIDSLSYKWKIVGGTRAVNVEQHGITGQFFRLRSGVLQGGQTYNLSVCASMPTWPSVACGFLLLETISRPLIPIFLRGGRSDLGVSEALQESVYIIDHDYSTETTFCTFYLTKRANGEAIYMRNIHTGNMLSSFSFFGSDGTQTSSNSIQVPWPNPSVYELPSGFMNLTVSCQRGQRRSSSTKLVQILPRPPPSVRILTEPSNKPINPNAVVHVTALVIASEITQTQWSVETQETGFGSLSLEQCSVGPPLADTCVPNRRCFITLVLQPGRSCSFAAGVSYQLLLIASASSGTAQAQFDFRVNAPPSGGALSVTPTQGAALETSFTLTIWPNITDDSDVFFSYSAMCCRQDSSSQCVSVTSEPTPARLLTTHLPGGNWICKASAIDSNGAGSDWFSFTTAIQVQAKQLTLAKLDDLLNNLNNISNSFDAPALGGMILSEPDTGLSPEEKNKKNELVQGLAIQDLLTLDTSVPSVSCLRTATSCQLFRKTRANKQYITNLVLRTLKKCLDAFHSQLFSPDSPNGARRRRDTSGSQGGTTSKITASEVKSVLEIASGVYHSTLDSTAAADIQATILNTVPAFCNNQNPNSLAQAAASTMAVVRVYKTSFNSVGSANLEMGCDSGSTDCLSNFKVRQQIALGADLEQRYYNWSCGQTDCFQDGACIGTILLDKDLLTPQAKVASPTISTRRSPLAYVGIFHPSDGANQNVSRLSNGVAITTNISGSVNLSSISLICRSWSGADWTPDNCTTRAPFQTDDGIWHVTCVCHDISSFIGVFEGPPGFQPETTIAPSTTKSETSRHSTLQSTLSETQTSAATFWNSITTTTLPPVTAPTLSKTDTVAVTLQIRVTESFSSVVTNESSLRSHLTGQLARQLRLVESQLTDMEFKNGSVLISFTVNSQSGANTSASFAVYLLVQLMNNRQLVLLSLSNSSLTVSWEYLRLLDVKSALQPTIKNGSDNTSIAVGASVGAFCLVVTFIVVILLMQRNKRNSKVPEKHESSFRNDWSTGRGSRAMETSWPVGVIPVKFAPPRWK
uniref:REJ domain-containing protein n=1 Tax=Macrostomum lignano TaxID=282301 RepID=A0A1I8H4L1_9PLAT